MGKMIEVIFDGVVFRPTEPIDLPANTRVRITIEILGDAAEQVEPYSFLDTAMSLNLEGPADWSTNIDKYLYGDLGADEVID